MSESPIWTRSAQELAAALDDRTLTSQEIVVALQQRADAVEPAVCGFALQTREQALRDAEIADEERRAGRVRSPLHGVPLTVKENIDVAGYASTLGLRRRRHDIASEDAVVVRLAKAAGMIVLGKSNVPQALVSGLECANPLFGTTRNPFSLEHGPGGSSGGEAALIATGASPLGIGTDLGGSIRFPAAFCGIVGLKPTTLRWSNLGVRSFLAGQEVIRAQVGPLARHVGDIALFMRVLDSPAHAVFDPEVAPLPLGDEPATDLKGLRVGWFDDDGFLTPAASARRAVREAAAALADLGATLVPFPPQRQLEALELYIAAVSSDGLRTALRQLRGDSIADTMREMWWAAHVPERLRRLGASVLPVLGEKRLAALVAASGRRRVDEYWQLADRRRSFRAEELHAWNHAGVDVVLCPAAATPPVPIGASRGLAAAFSYTARYNLIGFPAGVVPVTRVQSAETGRSVTRDRLDRLAAAVEARSADLPVAVQIAGRPFQEATVLRVLGAIERWARPRDGFPTTPIDPVAPPSGHRFPERDPLTPGRDTPRR